MSENTNHIKIPLSAAIFFGLFISCASFFLGTTLGKIQTTKPLDLNKNVFAVEKTSKPEFEFYVMSFCPFGNQMEDIVKPIYDLLGDKVEIRPRYIFDKVDDLPSFCKARSGDVSQCAAYVSNKYFKDEAECKKVINEATKNCLDEKAYIKSSEGVYYSSLHGRVEANQNVREICAYNLEDNKNNWWNFVDNVNINCNQQNADTCWEDQAKKAGLDTNKITECFNKDAISLIEKEIMATEKYNIQGSPTLLVNTSMFPPETAYVQDGTGSMTVGKKVIKQDKYRTPNAIKEAICASFNKAPKECKTELADPAPGETAVQGGC